MKAVSVTSVLAGAALLALVGWVAYREPMPGALAGAHADVPGLRGLANCDACHRADGFIAGCLSCHAAIASQIERGAGYHGAKAREGQHDCVQCHSEHHGADFPLVNVASWEGRDPARFDHEHVAFRLEGAHAALACPACHRPEFAGDRWPAARGADAPRETSFLGLTQSCVGCHADVHGPATHGRCTECHDQCSFAPSRFDHGTVFPLHGAHARATCEACHGAWREASKTDGATALGTPSIPFDRVRGRTCAACHDSPHGHANEASYGTTCERCHGAERFAPHRFAAAQHVARFPLRGAHARVACAACHRRDHPDLATTAPDDCQACHANPHRPGGSAVPIPADRRCADCHHEASWSLARDVMAIHERAGFSLDGAHAGTACRACHQPNRALPSNAGRRCDACHTSPHSTDFGTACTSCHRLADRTWTTPARDRFDAPAHARTGFALDRPHAGLACTACHDADAPYARRFPGRSATSCATCHADPHRGQFRSRKGGCRACHAPDRFLPTTFSAADHRSFPLTGQHAAVACIRCHQRDAAGVRRFAGTPRTCRSCHTDPHGGQLTTSNPDCTRCHTSTDSWRADAFDHDTHSRYRLEGVHRTLACRACHVARKAADGTETIHYRPLGRQCKDCHRAR